MRSKGAERLAAKVRWWLDRRWPILITIVGWFVLMVPLLYLLRPHPEPAMRKQQAPISLSSQLRQIRNDIAEQDRIIKGLQQHVLDILHSRCRVLEDRAKGVCNCEEGKSSPDWDKAWQD